MKAYKIKKTMVQEFVSFGDTREDAIDNFIESQGYDFDSVEINGKSYVNGEVLSSKVTATSLGTDNFIVFNQKDWKFAKAMWLGCHEDLIRIREYDGTMTNAKDIGNEDSLLDEEIKENIIHIADTYRRKLVTPVK